MTKRVNRPRKKPGPKGHPKGEKLVPIGVAVYESVKARFDKRAKDLGLSGHKLIVHLLDSEKTKNQ